MIVFILANNADPNEIPYSGSSLSKYMFSGIQNEKG